MAVLALVLDNILFCALKVLQHNNEELTLVPSNRSLIQFTRCLVQYVVPQSLSLETFNVFAHPLISFKLIPHPLVDFICVTPNMNLNEDARLRQQGSFGFGVGCFLGESPISSADPTGLGLVAIRVMCAKLFKNF